MATTPYTTSLTDYFVRNERKECNLDYVDDLDHFLFGFGGDTEKVSRGGNSLVKMKFNQKGLVVDQIMDSLQKYS